MIVNNTNQKDALIKEIKPYLNPREQDLLLATLKSVTLLKCIALLDFIKKLELLNQQFYIHRITFEKGKISARACFDFDSF